MDTLMSGVLMIAAVGMAAVGNAILIFGVVALSRVESLKDANAEALQIIGGTGVIICAGLVLLGILRTNSLG